jgi:hypothetical protein
MAALRHGQVTASGRLGDEPLHRGELRIQVVGDGRRRVSRRGTAPMGASGRMRSVEARGSSGCRPLRTFTRFVADDSSRPEADLHHGVPDAVTESEMRPVYWSCYTDSGNSK